MQEDATSSPWLSNGAEGGEEDVRSDPESSYLSPQSPHDDDVASPSHSLASSSPPEPMDALDGLSFGTSSSRPAAHTLPRLTPLPRYPRYPRYPLPVTPNQSSSHARSLCKGNRILCTTTLSYHILMPLPLTRLSRSTFLRASNIYSVGTLKPSMTHPFSTSVIPTK